MAPRRLHRAIRRWTQPLADGVGRLQALHARRLPRRLPDRGDRSHGVRNGGHSGRRLQRLRLLRRRVSLRRHQRARRSKAGGTSHSWPSGTMGKCTLCYDRLKAGDRAGVRQGVPHRIDSIRQRRRAARACATPSRAKSATAFDGAQLYLANEHDGIGGGGSIFLLLDRPEVYGLPPNPVVPTKRLGQMWRAAGVAAVVLAGAAALASLRL